LKYTPLELDLGEGLLVSPDGGYMFWVDILQGLVFRWDFANKPDVIIHLPLASSVNFVGGELVITAGLSVFFFDPETLQQHKSISIPTDRLELSAKEARVDNKGNLWIGLMERDSTESEGEVWILKRNEELIRLPIRIGIPNTFEWDTTTDLLYFADSQAGEIYRARVNQLDVSNISVFSGRGSLPGAPDGSFLDTIGGLLYNCRWGGGVVAVLRLDGQLEQLIELPSRFPTDCILHNDVLYVITAADQNASQVKGGLYSIPLLEL